jgi:hypothetical protein
MELELFNIDLITNVLPLIGVAGIFDTLFGRVDEDSIYNKFMDNPMMDKMVGAADNYMDWGSDYYKRAKDYMGNMFSQQAIDQSAAANRANAQNMAASGIDLGGGIAGQNMLNTYKDFGNKAFKSTKSSIFDMWAGGQSIASQLYGKVSDIYTEAAGAHGSATSANAANTASGLQGIIGAGIGMALLSDVRLKKDIKRVKNSTLYGFPMYEFKYKKGTFPAEFPLHEEFQYSGLMAQDVQKILPQAVYKNKKGYLSIDMAHIKREFDNRKGA